jgi:hypothetical protein
MLISGAKAFYRKGRQERPAEIAKRGQSKAKDTAGGAAGAWKSNRQGAPLGRFGTSLAKKHGKMRLW